MTPERAAELLPIITAFAEGKTIQFLAFNGEWSDVPSPAWDDRSKYRIKPTPTLRPWKPEEVPVGAVVRLRGTSGQCWLILSQCDGAVRTSFGVRDVHDLRVRYEHRWPQEPDTAWRPCGGEEV